jgi:sec-independent protein translocase protein TatA
VFGELVRKTKYPTFEQQFITYMGKFGSWEIILIALGILLLFGGRKIPELMKGIGKGIREFKEGVKGDNKDKESSADS